MKTWAKLAAFILLLLLVSVSSSADQSSSGPMFSIMADKVAASAGQNICISLQALPGQASAGAFRVSLQYDADHFQYIKKEDAAQVSGADVFVRQANPLVTVYTCDVRQGSAALLSGKVMSWVFHTKEDAKPACCPFLMRVDEVCDYDGAALPGSTASAEVQVTAAASSGAASSQAALPQLTALAVQTPAGGVLQPDFSPEITQYQMTVPTACKEVWFTTKQPLHTVVTVDRHTLCGAGSDTAITVAVRSTDDSARRNYVVVVHRQNAAAQLPQQEAPVLCRLAVTLPPQATLTPLFRPAVHRYEMTVPAECKQVQLQAAGEAGSRVTVSRRTLNAAGSSTPVTVTVTGKNQSAAVYEILVHRLAYTSSAVVSAHKATAGHTAVGHAASSRKAVNGHSVASNTGKRTASSKKTASRVAASRAKSSSAASDEAYTPSAPQSTESALSSEDGGVSTEQAVTVVVLVALAATAAVLLLRRPHAGAGSSHKP